MKKMANHTVTKLFKLALVATFTSIINAQAQSSVDFPSSQSKHQPSKPNIIWLITEDNSKHYLKLYEDSGAIMPTVEKLAENGLVFDNAFANTPVCSTARTTLATGLYGSNIGTMNHRSYHKVSLPASVKPFSQLLKKSGYYTTNNVKTDYNFSDIPGIWSESSNKANWKNRKNDQPFFHMQTFAITHESKLHFKKGAIKNIKTKHDPSKVTIAPIYPDTPTFRYTYARTLDNHQKADNQMAKLLRQLEADGELENTFIFYFGDHGGVLPGSKGYLFETGLSVPLVVRVPENFKHLLPKSLQQPNTRVSGLVSFIDFAPTVLALAGVKAPDAYPGQSFLSKDLSLSALNQRDEVFAQADRFDEKSDLVRSVRKGNFKYIRNYQPFYPDGLENFYRYKQLAFKEWRQLFKQGKLTPQQAAFFLPKKVEALYDLAKDPHEMNNLTNDANYQTTLLQLRGLMREHQRKIPDLGFIAESRLVQLSTDESFYDLGYEQHARIQQLIDVADLQLQPFSQIETQLLTALNHKDADVVYRALVTSTSFGEQAASYIPVIKSLLNNSSSIQVKSRALEFLTMVDGFDPTSSFAHLYQGAEHDLEKVELLNIATLLKEQRGFTFSQPSDATTPISKDKKLAKMVNIWLKNRWTYLSKSTTN
jgi:arylsulfatase A-like enzyme